MQRLIRSVAPMRDMLYKRACAKFLEQQKGRGVEIDCARTVEMLGDARTTVLDASLLVEGGERVRCACAPLHRCGMESFKKQPCWMMLTAGVALGCMEYAPLEHFAEEMSFAPARMARQYPLVERIPYDDVRCMETTLHREGAGLRAYAKGAPASVLARCDRIQEGKARILTAEDRAEIQETAAQMEREGLTALAFATKPLSDDGEGPETGMTFLGMVGVGDAPNEEAARFARTLGALTRPVLMTDRALPEGLLRATGFVRPQAGVMRGIETSMLDMNGLISACDVCDAFVEMDEMQRARVAKALRAAGRASVLAIGEAACGDVTATFSGGAANVSLHGGPEMLASVMRGCRAFLAENGREME